MHTLGNSRFVIPWQSCYDNTFYVMLRKKLTDAERERILTAIEKVKSSRFAVSEKELTNLRAIQG